MPSCMSIHEEPSHPSQPSAHPRARYHLYSIATQECERSIMMSAVNASKAKWAVIVLKLHIIVHAQHGTRIRILDPFERSPK